MLQFLRYIFCPWSVISELNRRNNALEDALMRERFQSTTTIAAMVLQNEGEFFVSEESYNFVSEQEISLQIEPTQGGVLMTLGFGDDDCDDCDDCDGCEGCDGESCR
jgi:hypothetical protein